MSADYYALLGVARDATDADIKRAYRGLARKLHPDANPDDVEAHERFKEITMAYEVLSDPQKRQRYDTFGAVQESRDPLGRVTTAHYDALGRTTETILPAYTPPGSSTPLTPVSTTTYDSTGRVKTVTDPLNRTAAYDYDQLGRMAKVTDPDGNSTTYTYDRLGNKTSALDPTGARTTATWGFLGQCSSTEHVRQPSTAAYTTQIRYGLAKTD